MVIIDRMYFVEGKYENYVRNKKSRIENAFNQVFYELRLPAPKYSYKLNETETGAIVEEVKLGAYTLNVLANSVDATIREITKFVIEYMKHDECYYTKDILNRGILGLRYDGKI